MGSGIKRPLILEIKGNSLDDGPGIRSVVFFKGCPLSCVWCHNPESKRATAEIGFDRSECVDCGTCISACSEKALSRDNRLFVDRSRCTLCFRCIETCPSGALSRVGKEMTVDEIAGEVLRDKPFFNTSGGGVTLSGGEPAMFMEFTSDLLRVLKRSRVHTLIETCGFFDFTKFEKMLLPYLNTVYFDIKIMNDDSHRKYTGVSNSGILKNFERLHEITKGSPVTLLPRTPLVPGITDMDGNMKGIAGFLKKLGITKAALMQYNPLWHGKADKVGADDRYRQDRTMTSWMERDQVKRCRKVFRDADIEMV